ncbi:WD40 repeat-like protein [Leucogyrophana mollusca]|uniref:WD40 repeat-like protein n=1 Tax=Leucogyrophana mollusca TaxID=85980 RepID=A0ACB8BW59_9AGAM|nr:WD40 repeat-like protein [Leucogyrophana mollusca]
MSTSTSPIESSAARRAPRGPTKVFKGHTEWVRSVAYFPDGQHIASASEDKTVIIWDVESGRQDGQPLRHDSAVRGIAISPDGRRIASGMQEDGLVIWDALTRKVVHEVKGGRVDQPTYSPDGRWIATASTPEGKVVRLWDADTGRPGREPLKCNGSVWCVAFSPDGSQIAAGSWDGFFQVFDIPTGESVVGPIKGHTGLVRSVVYSPDGCLLVTASDDKSIRVWDSKTGVQVGKPMLGHEAYVTCISISADGRRIASGDDNTVRVWDLETRVQHSINARISIWGTFETCFRRADAQIITVMTNIDSAIVRSACYHGQFLRIYPQKQYFRPWMLEICLVWARAGGGGNSTGWNIREVSGSCQHQGIWGPVPINFLFVKFPGNFKGIFGNSEQFLKISLSHIPRVYAVQVGDSFDVVDLVGSVAFSPDDRYIVSDNGNDVYLWDTEALAIQGPASSCMYAPTCPDSLAQVRARARSVTSSILDLPVVPAPVVPHQDVSSPFESKSVRRPSFDSILDLPMAPEPGNQRPREGRPHNTGLIHPRLRPAEPQQDPPLEPEAPPVQPAKPGHKRSRNIRERWRDIRRRKSRVPTDLPAGSSHSPLPLHEHANAPASPEVSTNQRSRRERDADAQGNTQAPHPRTRPSSNQNEANVALGRLDEPLLETERNNAAGVPESGAELLGTTNWIRTRTQSPKMMMQSHTMRTRGAWTPFVSGSTSGGGGTCRGNRRQTSYLPRVCEGLDISPDRTRETERDKGSKRPKVSTYESAAIMESSQHGSHPFETGRPPPPPQTCLRLYLFGTIGTRRDEGLLQLVGRCPSPYARVDFATELTPTDITARLGIAGGARLHR